jgi:hypothetical protein
MPGFVQVPVGLQEHDVVAGCRQSVDQGAAVAAPAVGVSVMPGPRKPQKL